MINLIVTMIQFCPFYAYIYYGKVFYYEGKPSPVSVDQMAFALMNFSVEEVSIQYYSLFPSLLLTSVIFLFFNKYKPIKKLGEGSFGKIYSAININNKQKFALKMVIFIYII